MFRRLATAYGRLRESVIVVWKKATTPTYTRTDLTNHLHGIAVITAREKTDTER